MSNKTPAGLATGVCFLSDRFSPHLRGIKLPRTHTHIKTHTRPGWVNKVTAVEVCDDGILIG